MNAPATAVVPLMGPPGSGKTTALVRLERRHPEVARFGVRDYGLRLAGTGSALGRAVRGPLLRRDMLDDDLVRAELAHFLDHLPAGARHVVVEGYPRNMRQCADLVDLAGDRLTAAVLLRVGVDEVRRRVAGRLVCPSCGPRTGAGPACPACERPLERRADDTPRRAEQRLRDDERALAPVARFFAERHLLCPVDAGRDADAVYRELERIVVGAPVCGRAGREVR